MNVKGQLKLQIMLTELTATGCFKVPVVWNCDQCHFFLEHCSAV